VSQNKVFLALGSNVGNWKVNFNSCLMELKKISKLKAIANIYVSKPYGYKKQNDFYNTVVEVKTRNNPFQLMNQIKIIEKKLHKNKILINGPRRIDIDIIFFNSLNISYKKLIIPHPRVSERDFVLLPLFDIDPFFKHPQSKKSIKALTTALKTTYIKKSIRQPKEMFVIH
jgi:2-amino-4-hydroxy-6-hydroxymethyldihydropteridine diphosphokinase|tara:strand:- start:485 stop:997 length:513 start_codon:yes stop_codon:yes gene_type:complete